MYNHTPHWKLVIPTVCFELCKYKKSDNDPVLYRSYYTELLFYLTYIYFTDGSKYGDKIAATFIRHSFVFSKRLPENASISYC